MSYPDYSTQGWQHILVSLDGPVAIVKLNRTKQYANLTPFYFTDPRHRRLKLFGNTDATRLRYHSWTTLSLPMNSLTWTTVCA
jgi:hypothetical protein